MTNRFKLNLRLPKIAVTPRVFFNGLGYAGFFLFCFVLFAYLTFPYDRARAYFLTQFNQQTLPGGRVKPSDVQLKIADMRPSWLTGVKMTGVELIKQATQPEDQPMVISADYATLRPSIRSRWASRVHSPQSSSPLRRSVDTLPRPSSNIPLS